MTRPSRIDPGRSEDGLSPLAALSGEATRERPEEPCPWRTAFQRDRDRIIHSKPFRRLAHKTQVFVATTGDHYRTRLTHTLEVSQIARTLARGFNLNEDLAETISLGHDLGHTPFGHAGERCLNKHSPRGFRHQDQSVRVVERLAKNGVGLNLTREVLDGIARHSKGRGPVFAPPHDKPLTLEAQLVRASDLIAYLAHDLDDALESGLLTPAEIPPRLVEFFGERASSRIGIMVSDLLNNSDVRNDAVSFSFSPETHKAMEDLRTFLGASVYSHPALRHQLDFAQNIISYVYKTLMENDRLYNTLPMRHLAVDRSQAVCDFVSGMTDRYAFSYAQNLAKGLTPGTPTDLDYDVGPLFVEF
ncbi:MAG: deoxyguanosinetriphosphate triphosphohydrolase [Deltaproteobacteria bacterium]|jgi:dGTPase|nr:deoxyguanosinetriphosphate triphosphohydrolase [Deltaproteobacteria bacterium]